MTRSEIVCEIRKIFCSNLFQVDPREVFSCFFFAASRQSHEHHRTSFLFSCTMLICLSVQLQQYADESEQHLSSCNAGKACNDEKRYVVGHREAFALYGASGSSYSRASFSQVLNFCHDKCTFWTDTHFWIPKLHLLDRISIRGVLSELELEEFVNASLFLSWMRADAFFEYWASRNGWCILWRSTKRFPISVRLPRAA